MLEHPTHHCPAVRLVVNLHFWWDWKTPAGQVLTEVLSGLMLTAGIAVAALVVTHWPCFLARLAVVTAGSLAYELVWDANGWSLKDVAQREIGLVLAVILWGNLL